MNVETLSQTVIPTFRFPAESSVMKQCCQRTNLGSFAQNHDKYRAYAHKISAHDSPLNNTLMSFVTVTSSRCHAHITIRQWLPLWRYIAWRHILLYKNSILEHVGITPMHILNAAC